MQTLMTTSNSNEIKSYFTAILKLTKENNEFPVDLDDVWSLVYSRKDKAVRALIQGEEYMQNLDYQVLPQNGGNLLGGRPTEKYYLSVQCLEFFIARKVRAVFEVYRQVFHQKVNEIEQSVESPAEMFYRSAKLMVENERRMKSLENKVDDIEQRTRTDIKHSTVIGYITRFNIKCDVSKVSAYGSRASRICRKRGVVIGKVNDPRWGKVNLYPDEVLDEIFMN
ncbi:MAG: hypothetical protein SNH27_14085 [Rikenellaceae bacterium]